MKFNMKVAICIEIKNENRYIREWLDYHKNLGFDNIILYDNNDTNGENIYEIISNDIKNGYIIYENIKDKTNYQLPCYNECMKKYHNIFDWILFLDCDEFLELRKVSNIKEWLNLSKFNNFEQILINLDNYGDSNLIYDDGGSVIERFKIKKDKSFNDKCIHTKPCIRMCNYNETYEYKGFPNCLRLYNTTCDVNGDKIFPTRILFTENEDCVIRHYKTKTIEEYIKRHKSDCHYNISIQLIANKLKGFFEVNDSEANLEEKINIIKKEFPWYRHMYNHYEQEPIDIIIIDDNNPLLTYTINSIRKNLNWIHNIFIVGDNDKNIKDTHFISKKNIIPDEFKNDNFDVALFFHNIKELSNKFIYVYNGTIFNYICHKDEFFRLNKICMYPMMFSMIPTEQKKLVYNNNEIFLTDNKLTDIETFRVSKGNVGYMFSHVCCPMIKEHNEACFDYLRNEIIKYNQNINHLIYPTWTRIMYDTFDYMHSGINIQSCENIVLEVNDPIYKICNIPIEIINDDILNILNKRYDECF